MVNAEATRSGSNVFVIVIVGRLLDAFAKDSSGVSARQHCKTFWFVAKQA
jgi:hypothetical protein